jgi:hypothetical protein
MYAIKRNFVGKKFEILADIGIKFEESIFFLTFLDFLYECMLVSICAFSKDINLLHENKF